MNLSIQDNEESQTPKRHSLVWDITRVLCLIAIFVCAGFLFQNETFREKCFDVENVRRALHPKGTISQQLIGYGIFLFVSFVVIALGIPRIWISAAAGSLYGAFLGSILGLIASLAGASGTYFLSHSFLRGVAHRRLGTRFERWNIRFHQHAFLWTLYMRLFPIFNTTLGSLICGSCGVRYLDFLTASTLGFAPMAIVFAVLGSGAVKGNVNQLGVGTVLFLVVFGLQGLFTKVIKRKEKTQNEKSDNGD